AAAPGRGKIRGPVAQTSSLLWCLDILSGEDSSERQRRSETVPKVGAPRLPWVEGTNEMVRDNYCSFGFAHREAQPKLLERTQWVANPTRKRLATPGSESCVVVRNGGTKRR